MDDNRFFKAIWRINALTIAMLLVFAVCLIAWEFGLKNILNPRDVSQVVNIDTTDTSLVQSRKIGAPNRLEGHNLYVVFVESEQHYDTEYSTKGTRNTRRNIGIFNPEIGVVDWLFPTQDQLITDVITLFEHRTEPSGQKTSFAHSMLITFVDQDTNGDKRLSNSDTKSLFARKILESSGETILTNLHSDPSVQALRGTQSVLFFRRDDVMQSAIYDRNDMQIIRETAIPLP